MRKLITAAFVSLDGVMQAPGGPEEDTAGGFGFGGWTAPHFDETLGESMGEMFAQPFDLVLGRRTYDIFAAHWPHYPTDPAAPGYDPGEAHIAQVFNGVTKHVATHRPDSLAWANSRSLGDDIVATVRELKGQDGPLLLTQGSSELVQALAAADLVDEYRLLIFPVLLGRGKRLFADKAAPGAMTLVKSSVSSSGVIVATYARAGAVQTGSFALENPSGAEIDRRRDQG